MLSDEEKEKLEQARSNITRGVDIESAMLILEKCALDGIIFTGGRVNIFKIAVRQILNFLEEYKDKGYLDIVREKVKANEIIEKQSKEIEELKNTETYKIAIIDKDKYISKDKIKAKIEELENEKEKYFEKQVIQHEIETLQSLLEKE